jgi:hypothetical protein
MADAGKAEVPDFPAETRRQVYIREAICEGKMGWAVFDHDGEAIHHHEFRSTAFFFA